MSQSCNILNCDKVFNSLAALTKHQSSVHYCGHVGCPHISADMASQKDHVQNDHRKTKKSISVKNGSDSVGKVHATAIDHRKARQDQVQPYGKELKVNHSESDAQVINRQVRTYGRKERMDNDTTDTIFMNHSEKVDVGQGQMDCTENNEGLLFTGGKASATSLVNRQHRQMVKPYGHILQEKENDDLDMDEVNQSYHWISTPLLESIGFGHHSLLGVLICMTCKKCWSPSNVLKHALHHDSTLSISSLQTKLKNFVQQYNIPEKPQLKYPQANRVPIKGLYIHRDGYSCAHEDCDYACLLETTLQDHWKRKHVSRIKHVATDQRYTHPANVQSYFKHTSNRYWLVNIALMDRASDDLYGAFVKQFLPAFEADITILPPMLARDVHPWLRVSGFPDYLKDNALNKEKRIKHVEAATHPSTTNHLCKTLYDWVFNYLAAVRHLSQDEVPYMFLKYIKSMEHRTDAHAKAFTVHYDDKILKDYCGPIMNLLWYLDAALKDGSLIQLPITEKQKQMVEEFSEMLQEEKEDLHFMHQYFYSFTAPPQDDTPLGRWKDPVMCFIAIWNLLIDGSYKPVSLVTKEFARWEYDIRSSCLYEISLKKGTVSEIERYAAEICNTRLTQGRLSPFNSIYELQHYASALVFTEPHPPRAVLSEDISIISIDGIPLALETWRIGLKKLYSDIEARIMKVLKNTQIPFHVPNNIQDDMSVGTHDYSWLHMGTYTERPNPLLCRYLEDPDEKLAYIGPDNAFHFYGPRAREVMGDMAFINKGLCMMHDQANSQGLRGTTLADLRIGNGTRKRNHFRHHGQTRHIIQGTKMTNAHEMDIFLPILMAPDVQRLDDMYLILLRPMEEVIAYALWGPESRMLYREFMFVQMGLRVTETMLYKQFPSMFKEYTGVEMSISEYRLWAIAVMREYIAPEYHPRDYHDTVGDRAGQHSTPLARHVYSPVEGDLPYLTTDAMWFHDMFCLEWQDISGFGEFEPPLPLKILRKMNRRIKGISSNNESALLPGSNAISITSSATATVTNTAPSSEMTLVASTASDDSSNITQILNVLLNKIDNLESQIKAQNIAFGVQLQKLKQEMTAEMRSVLVQGLATLHQPIQPNTIPGANLNGITAVASLKMVVHDDDDGLNNQPDTNGMMPVEEEIEEGEEEMRDVGEKDIINQDDDVDMDDLYGPLVKDMPGNVEDDLDDGLEMRALDAMRSALGDMKATWRSNEQKDAVLQALQMSHNVVAVLKTGAGKSMVWIICALLQDAINVVMVPYSRLLQQHVENAKRMGCRAMQWTCKSGSIGNNNLIFVALETAASSPFLNLIEDNNVSRFFGDEAHLFIISENFRPDFTRLWQVALKKCQRNYFTATLPPSLSQYFMEKTCLHLTLTQWIHGETNRPELRYHVAKIDAKCQSMVSVLSKLAKKLEAAHFGPTSRGVIFGANIQMVKDLGTEMDCFTHYSEQNTANAINMERWKEGYHLTDNGQKHTQQWMIATPGLINGIDLDRIDAVLFGEEGLGGLFGGVQGTGRGGRTGHPCICVLVTSGTFNPPVAEGDILHMADMKRWTGELICRRLIVSDVMDGTPIECGQLEEEYPKTEFCDICEPNTTITCLIQDAIREAAPPCHVTHLDDTDVLPISLGSKISIPRRQSKSGSSSNHSGSSVQATKISIRYDHSTSRISTTSINAIKPGMAVEVNRQLMETTLEEKYRKTRILNDCITHLHGSCYVCWILYGTFKEPSHEPIFGCGLGKEGWGMGWSAFKFKYLELLPKYHFCYGCGVPQKVNYKPFEPEAHEGYGGSCNIKFMAPQMIFALKRSAKTWRIISDKFFLNPQMSDQDFAKWVAGYKPNTGDYYNGLEMLIWFLLEFRFTYN